MGLLQLCLLFIISYFPRGTRQVCDMPPRVHIYPRNPFRYNGEPLNMSCRVLALPGQTLDEGKLQLMAYNDEKKPVNCSSEISFQNSSCIVINSIKDVYIPTIRTFQEIQYTCVFYSECGEQKEFTLVTVDNYPKSVDNVSCTIYYWESITCVLDLGQYYRHRLSTDPDSVMRIDVYIRKEATPGQLVPSNWIRCPELTFVNTTVRDAVTCSWDSSDSESFTSGVYEIQANVTNQITKDSVKSSLRTTVNVIPNSVSDVVVRSKNSTAVTLGWSHVVNEAVTYEVKVIPWSTLCGPTIRQKVLTNLTSATITGLKPFTNHTLSITSVPITHNNMEHHRSDPTTINVTTYADVPQSNPDLDPGSFHADVNNSQLQLFWQPTSPCQQNGPHLIYRITITYNNETEEHLEKMADDFTANIPINLNETCNIQLQACNNVGCARGPSSFLIFSANRPTTPDHVTVNAINDTVINVSWHHNNTSDVTDYTIQWCETAGNHTCVSSMKNQTVYPYLRNLYVHLPGPYTDYLFGVSAEAKAREGLISSGISWSTCIQLTYGLPNIPMDISVNYTDNGILLLWNQYERCNSEYGVADIAKLTIQNLDKGNKTVMDVTMSSESYLVTDLSPGRYVWWIQGVFPGGLNTHIRKGAFVINEKPNNWKYIPIIFVIIVLALIVPIAVVFCMKGRKYLRGLEKEMKIDPPEIDDSHEDSGISDDCHPKTQVSMKSYESIPLIPVDSRKGSPSPDLAYSSSQEKDSNFKLNGSSNVGEYFVVKCNVSDTSHYFNGSATNDQRNTDKAYLAKEQHVTKTRLIKQENEINSVTEATEQGLTSADDYMKAEQQLSPLTNRYMTVEQQPSPPTDDYMKAEQQSSSLTDEYMMADQQMASQQLLPLTEDHMAAEQQSAPQTDGYVTESQLFKPENRIESETPGTQLLSGYVTETQVKCNANGYVTEEQL